MYIPRKPISFTQGNIESRYIPICLKENSLPESYFLFVLLTVDLTENVGIGLPGIAKQVNGTCVRRCGKYSIHCCMFNCLVTHSMRAQNNPTIFKRHVTKYSAV